MSQWAREHPELCEQGVTAYDYYTDYADMAEDEPCRVCGEYLTRGGVPCRRCKDGIENDRLERESNR